MKIRLLTAEDYDALYALWTQSDGVGLRAQDDSREGIARYLRRNPNTCFAAEDEDGRLLGAILSGHDGRRGVIGHTAVRQDARGRGVGRALVQAVEEAMRREGILKLTLVAFTKNKSGNAFWEKMGYTVREDLTYRNKPLVQE